MTAGKCGECRGDKGGPHASWCTWAYACACGDRACLGECRPKRKPGRPPIPPEQRRRGRQAVAVKFSAVEYAQIRAGAIAAGMSVPDYLLAGVR